ncbi:leucine carboxyl methyltransferase 2 [Pyrenophora tritici-repentis]|nr:Leucine carboxyl methyltransferase 2 [Pyrenophora tritici-repentis]KAI1550097.1 leucine carboxyl methyltransferase 2 [Pyrenophora tritici-repentis]KAI1556268.1 leucine carboxyl methyltransferase 2 [Pyrenophora tritici-repentis]KAI2479657.1 Leucine carboxyl methyltransferase 2 [Pyrenophora tritici-repentis]
MAMMGNMPPKKSAPKRKGNQKTLRERRDVDIMNVSAPNLTQPTMSLLLLSLFPARIDLKMSMQAILLGKSLD